MSRVVARCSAQPRLQASFTFWYPGPPYTCTTTGYRAPACMRGGARIRTGAANLPPAMGTEVSITRGRSLAANLSSSSELSSNTWTRAWSLVLRSTDSGTPCTRGYPSLYTRVPCHLAEARVHVVAGAGVHAHAAPCALLAARGHQLACHTSEVDIFILILENGSSYLPDVPALGRHCVEVEAAGPPRRGAEQVDEPRVVLTNERRGNRVWTNERSPGPRRGSS